MTEKKVAVVHVTGHHRLADWASLLKEFIVPKELVFYDVEGTLLKTDIVVLGDYHISRESKNNPITVKGNSRQEVVQGKRHSWPTAKKRKGFKS